MTDAVTEPTDEQTVEIDGEPVAPLAARAPVKPDSPAFSDFPINPAIVQALADVGIHRTFAIQELTLPIALEGKDLIGQARTGTGKTLGFGVPLLNRLPTDRGPGTKPYALVIAPTRELAVQVSGDLAAAGKRLGARVLTIYGGRAYEPQIDALKKGVDVVVGTPGRLLDLTQQGHLSLDEVRILVLDEADEMLDLGFLPDIERLMGMIPAGRQTMLFSATMPGPIVALARKFLQQPIQIRAEQEQSQPSTEHIDQFVYRAHAMDKLEMLARVLQTRNRGLALIFTRTKRTAAKVVEDLEDRGFAAAAIHGDLGQGAREQALRAFRSGKVDVLVATDVAARGLEVEGITHVVNYQAPEDAMTYVHRIGRTARAGASGTAVTFVDWDEIPRWKLICDELKLPFHEPAETYSTSPHLALDLDIPDGVTGTLPRAARTRAGLDAEEIEDLGGRSPAKDRGGRRRGAGGEQDDKPVERKPRPARTRARRRTRGGQDADGGVEQSVDGPDAGEVSGDPGANPVADAAAVAAETGTPTAGGTTDDGAARKPRRRRRGGRGRGAGGPA
ncbi:MAG: DEAD/DEAH box helicase, partial [Jatrophihabitans sp.]|uniref:DEAD/DEAH box helicase n=1 Tax=Jatrophihabitans sp. TaxID=1932789 RepID=UPI003F7D36BA